MQTMKRNQDEFQKDKQHKDTIRSRLQTKPQKKQIKEQTQQCQHY